MRRSSGILPLSRAAVLLAPVALGLLALRAWPTAPRVQSITLGDLPDAVLLDPHAGRAYIARAEDGTLSLLDLARGRVVRTVPIAAPGTLAALALALDPATNHLFVATDLARPGLVQMLDGRTGVRLASFPLGQAASALAVDARHRHVLVADDSAGTLGLLDARTGALLHAIPLGLLPLALAVDERTGHTFVAGPVSPGMAALSVGFAGVIADVVGMLDTRTGALLHVTAVGSGPSALAVDPMTGRVFVACEGDATVRVLDARSGAPLRTVTLPAAPSALAVDERRGRVYVISAAAGLLSLLDARTGALLATRRVDPFASAAYARPDALAVDEARDRVYLSTDGPLGPGPRGPTLRGNGTLYVVDARTGAVLRRIAVGVAPQAVAVDARSGRVVVLNGGGEVLRPLADWSAPWIGRLRQWLPELGRGAPPQPTTERAPGSVSLIDGAP
jgi:DNA-binding beta-propeller fold protein YncE